MTLIVILEILRAANGSIQSETVRNDDGVNAFFPLPIWQKGLEVTNGPEDRADDRGLPDQQGLEVR
jgi:hypothetical protein